MLYSGEELGAQFAWSLGLAQETEESEETKTLELLKILRDEMERKKILQNMELVEKIKEQILLFKS